MSRIRKHVLVIAPAYNEATKIGKVVTAVLAIPEVDAMLVVDDCSVDETSAEARASGALVVRHGQNRGVGAVIRTGIVEGKRSGYDVIAVISGDDQHVASELPRVIGPVMRGECAICQGSRFLPGGRVIGRNFFREPLIRVYSAAFTLLSGHKLTDATNGLRAFRSDLFESGGIDLDQAWLDTYELEPYMLYQAARRGLRIKEVPCTIRYPSGQSYSHMKPVFDWWRLLRPLLLLRLGLRS